MQFYCGLKIISAKPMSLGEYNDYRAWIIPDNEDPATEGYLVEYDGESNHQNHIGYISWLPKTAFDRIYQTNGSLSFGHALVATQSGKDIQRASWNGKSLRVRTQEVLIEIVYPDGTTNLWAPSLTDILANDWTIVGGA